MAPWLLGGATCGSLTTKFEGVRRVSQGAVIACGTVLVVGLAASVVVFGEDFERLVTDVEAERAHPSLANAGRAVGQAARTAKDALGIASGAAAVASL